MDTEKRKYFRNRNAFRKWLVKHCYDTEIIWIEFHKEKESISYSEAPEEALCFGWIDSIIKNVNHTTHIRKFTPRNPKSKWSEKNKALADKLISEGKMTEHGLTIIKVAKESGEWSQDRRSPASAIRAHDLKKFLNSLKKYPESFSALNKMSQSMKSQYAGYYLQAKKEETRERRLKNIAENILKGRTLF